MLPDVHVLTMPKALSDEEFYEFCIANRQLRIERDKEGKIWIMSPTNTNTGRINANILRKLGIWLEKYERGILFNSSTGFNLSNGAVRSPDVAWMSKEKWDKLPDTEKNKFAAVCPDFIVELKSPSDEINTLKIKMKEWVDNGVSLGWLIDPQAEHTWIYRKQKKPELIKGFDHSISGDDILTGFELKLSSIL